jgi:hypothetical protein
MVASGDDSPALVFACATMAPPATAPVHVGRCRSTEFGLDKDDSQDVTIAFCGVVNKHVHMNYISGRPRVVDNCTSERLRHSSTWAQRRSRYREYAGSDISIEDKPVLIGDCPCQFQPGV